MTKTFFSHGTFRWAKVYGDRVKDGEIIPSQADKKYDDNGVFSVDFAPDDPAEFLASGIRVEPKEFEGKQYFPLRRHNKKIIKGELVDFGPPEVLHRVDDTIVPLTENIGNGSTGMVKFITYPAGRYLGHRLEKIFVEELVSWNGSSAPDMPF